jgi:hypothetical protein
VGIPKDPSREIGFAREMRPHQDLFHRWAEGNPGAKSVRFGIVTAVNTQPNDPGQPTVIPGTIDIACTDGTSEPNCNVLTGPNDWNTGAGEDFRPYRGSRCVILTGPGGEAWACGFTRPITSGFAFDDGRDKRVLDRTAISEGDWERRSPSGAKIALTAGGIIQLLSSPACFVQLNPETGEVYLNSQLSRLNADGYKSRKGRLPGTGTSPSNKTLSREVYMDRVTATTATHFIVDTGAAGTAATPAVRQVTIKSNGVVVLGTEYYTTSAGFVGKMKTYHYGSATSSENIPLGQVLKQFLSDFLSLFAKHTHGSAVGPTSPPVEFAEALKLKVHPIEDEAILCSFMFTQKLPPL